MDPRTLLLLQTVLAAAFGACAVLWLRGRRLLWAIATLTLLVGIIVPVATFDPPDVTARRLRIISVLDGATTSALVTAFTRETGIACDVDPFAGGTQTTVELIQQGRVQPDVLLGGTVEIHARLAAEGKLLACPPLADPDRIDRYDDPEHRWTPLYLGYLALIYRPLPTLLSHPPDWITLIQPQWRGRVTIPSPTTSGGGLVFLATQIQRQADPELAWRYVGLLAQAGAHFEDRSDLPISRVADGSMDLGVAWAHDVLRRRQDERLPVEIRIPEPTGYEVGAVSILEWARDPEAARSLVRFLMGAPAGEIQVRVGRRVPLRTDVDPPEYLDAGSLGNGATAFYDRSEVLAHREEWISRWEDLLRAAP